MKLLHAALLAGTMLTSSPALAQEETGNDDASSSILVTAHAVRSASSTKTDTPAAQVPQPVTVVTDDIFQAQGAVSVSDTLNYVAGVQANPYGPDSRVDGGFIRGINALQFRDGMRDIFSYYASIRADPYNFSQVEVLRGPAGALFGSGSIGGIVNLVSKTPEFTPSGEVAIRYGSYDRKELLADITGPISGTLAGRVVGRVRDSGTQTDYVSDDRVMVSPSLTWQPSMDTSLTLIGLYQEDDGGSTSQFLPLVGTILPNPNGQLPGDLFIGKPGWDRYDGRLAQGTAIFTQRINDQIQVSSRARYIDSDLDYFTHYPNSYTNPTNPYLDPDQRIISNYADGSIARMEIFSTDTNLTFSFDTGSDIEHTLLAGIDYIWSRVRKQGGFALENIDIYDIDYDALSNFNGSIPMPGDPGFVGGSSEDTSQRQLGIYLQDQIRFFDRVSLVLGVRRDQAKGASFGAETYSSDATTFRAGLIGEIVPGVSPFVSYTESFEPIAGTDAAGAPFIPKQGEQYEAGIKFHPTDTTMITFTAYHITEQNRPISDDSTADPNDQIQAGELRSRGLEFSASTLLPGEITVIANYSYNEAELTEAGGAQAALIGVQLDNVPQHNASLWATRPFRLSDDVTLVLGGGVRHSGENTSFGFAFPNGIVTPSYTLVDALAELNWQNWSLRINANNLLDDDFYSACLARGDCFEGADRNVMGTLSYNF